MFACLNPGALGAAKIFNSFGLVIRKKYFDLSGSHHRFQHRGMAAIINVFLILCFSTSLSIQYVGHLRATSRYPELVPPRVSKTI